MSPGSDLHYLLGESHASFERLTVLVVRPDHPPVLVVPEVEAGAWSGLARAEEIEIVAWSDGEDAHALAGRRVPDGTTVAVSGTLPSAHLLALGTEVGGATFVVDDAVRRLRSVKDAWEVEQLRAAGRALDTVHQQLPGSLVPGRTEQDVKDDIHGLMAAAGFASTTFVAVASGESGSDPHHAATSRRLRADDIVFVDISGRWETGYHADSTRTFALRTPSRSVACAYDALRESFDAAVAAVRPGARAEDVDLAARSVLERHGLGRYFRHRTGHGIGLDVHESPDIVRGNDEVLCAGMTFSIEPGIYLPDYGARIEDIVVVTDEGCDQLNQSARDLVVV